MFFRCFFVKKRTKRGILFSQNGTVFYAGSACFSNLFLLKKEQNVKFQINYQGNVYIIERQFSQNVTVFYARDGVFIKPVFRQKKRKREI